MYLLAVHKIILDTDIGDDIDDALALAFALMCQKIELLRLTPPFPGTGGAPSLPPACWGRRGAAPRPPPPARGRPRA
ncbi:MAG: hypothetical protein OXC31_19745, partial [Spirochaetaceae bacterium]|nr:hypothetical protein [Spirochaetaceae bacterium]